MPKCQNGWVILRTLYWPCDFLSTLESYLNHVDIRDSRTVSGVLLQPYTMFPFHILTYIEQCFFQVICRPLFTYPLDAGRGHLSSGREWEVEIFSRSRWQTTLATVSSMRNRQLRKTPVGTPHLFIGLSLQWRHNECDGVTDVLIYCSTVCSGADQRQQQSSASLAFVRGVQRWPVDPPSLWASNAEYVSIWWRRHAGLSFIRGCHPREINAIPVHYI